MRKIASMLLVALALVASAATAENLVVPAERQGFPSPPSWQLKAAGVDFDSDGVFIWVDSEGNCRYEYRQECYTRPDGSVVCRQVPEWKCDRDTAYYALPATCTVNEDAKRAYYTPEGGEAITFGKVKSFLWSKWIGLFEGASLDVTHDSAALVLDPEQLATDGVQENFRELHQATE